MGRHNAGLHGVEGTAHASHGTGNCKHQGFVSRGVVAGEAQARLVIADGDQGIAKATTGEPAAEQPRSHHQHHSEPEKVALHGITAHQLPKDPGGISFEAIGAINQLLLAIKKVEKDQQGRLGKNRKVDPLDAVAKN